MAANKMATSHVPAERRGAGEDAAEGPGGGGATPAMVCGGVVTETVADTPAVLRLCCSVAGLARAELADEASAAFEVVRTTAT